jgi:hypothetical protein
MGWHNEWVSSSLKKYPQLTKSWKIDTSHSHSHILIENIDDNENHSESNIMLFWVIHLMTSFSAPFYLFDFCFWEFYNSTVYAFLHIFSYSYKSTLTCNPSFHFVSTFLKISFWIQGHLHRFFFSRRFFSFSYMSYSESNFSNRMSKNGNPCYIGSDSFISKQGNSVVNANVIPYFCEVRLIRLYLLVKF